MRMNCPVAINRILSQTTLHAFKRRLGGPCSTVQLIGGCLFFRPELRNEIATAALVVAIVISAGAGYLIGVATQQSVTSGLISPSTVTLTCALAPKGSALYIRITLDGAGTPVTNATVDATPVETCNGVNTTIAIIWHPPVNASGIATLNASGETFYSVTVNYGSQSYPFTAYIQSFPATCASLSVPSGSLTVSSC